MIWTCSFLSFGFVVNCMSLVYIRAILMRTTLSTIKGWLKFPVYNEVYRTSTFEFINW